jgi:putative hydrolase of the HAD superfamily
MRVILFDLDNTIYPLDSGVMELISQRITRFMEEQMGLPPDEVARLRHDYWLQYGTTLRGLQIHHGVDPDEYLAYVHDIPLEEHLRPDPELDRMLTQLAPDKVIFTNATTEHARRVLRALGVERHFSRVFDIRFLDYCNKPDEDAYRRVLDELNVAAGQCLLVEDSARNIGPARALGMKTVLVGAGQADRSRGRFEGSSGPVGPADGADFTIPHILDLPTVVEQLDPPASKGAKGDRGTKGDIWPFWPVWLLGFLRPLVVALAYFAALFFAVWLLRDLPVPARPIGYLVSTIASLFAAGGVMMVVGSMTWSPDTVPDWSLAAALVLIAVADVFFVRLGIPLLSSLAVLIGAALVGVVLDRFVFVDRSVLLLLCALYIVVDTYSVFFGPTGAIVQRGGPVLSALTVHFPMVGTGRVVPLIGGTDFAVWTACLLGARRFGFDYVRSFVAMALSLIATSLIGIALLQPVPALPLMMVVYLWVNRHHFDFRNRELWAVGGAALAIVLVVGVITRWVLTR